MRSEVCVTWLETSRSVHDTRELEMFSFIFETFVEQYNQQQTFLSKSNVREERRPAALFDCWEIDLVFYFVIWRAMLAKSCACAQAKPENGKKYVYEQIEQIVRIDSR